MKKLLALFILIPAFFIKLACTDDATIKQSLVKFGTNSGDIHPTPAFDIKITLTNSDALSSTEDINHIIQRPIYNVSSVRQVNKANLMNNLNALEKEMIIYKASQEKYAITVFTDITCGYCRELHKQIKNYNALGITVRYLAFSRADVQNKSKQNMQSIWCAENRNKALDSAMNGQDVQPALCGIDIANHYALGVQFGVTGTPTILLNNGYLVLGYQGPKEMKAFLDAHQSSLMIK